MSLITKILQKDRLQAVSIGMQAYGMKIDLLTNATVVEGAVQFVEKHLPECNTINRCNRQLRFPISSCVPILLLLRGKISWNWVWAV